MTDKKPNLQKFLKSFVIWFAIFYLAMLGYQKFLAPQPAPEVPGEAPVIVITPVKSGSKISIGNLARWEVENTTTTPLTLADPCTAEAPTMRVLRMVNGQQVEIENFLECGDKSAPKFTIQPEEIATITMQEWNNDIFSEEGEYALELTLNTGDDSIVSISEPIVVKEAGMLKKLFRAIISRPLFNILVFFTQVLPNHSLGLSIIFLTLIARLALFMPNQKAMRSQRKMQQMQPKLQEIKEKHKDNQQVIAQKTMELYKTHKISPVSSCLPMLIQFPILIGVYWIVRDGLSPHLSPLLYSFQSTADLSIVSNAFLGLNLAERNLWVLPIVVGGTQWIAVKLSLIAGKKRKKKAPTPTKPNQMEQMNVIMLWVMPVMIAFFAGSLPAAVGIYWFTSTVFGIGQQIVVNRQLDRPQVVKKA